MQALLGYQRIPTHQNHIFFYESVRRRLVAALLSSPPITITMASKSLESRSEIEGAKRQLTVAQKWQSSANDMLKVTIQTQIETGAPKQIIEFAREQISLSEKEVHEAQAYLKKVEARWEVISIDVDDNEPVLSSSKVQNNTNISHAPSLSNQRLNDDAVILSDDSNDAEDSTNTSVVFTTSTASSSVAATTAPQPPTFNIGNKVILQNSTPTYNNQLGIIKSKPNDTLYTIELLSNRKLVNAKLINMKLVDGSVANESVTTAASASNSIADSSLVIGSKVILKGTANTSYNGQQGVIKSMTLSHHAGGKTVYRVSLPEGKETYVFSVNMQQVVEQNDAVVNNDEAVASISTDNAKVTNRNDATKNDAPKVKSESEKEQIVLELSSDDEEEDYIPHHLTVHGCDSDEINGIFTLAGMHNGAPRYTKQGQGGLWQKTLYSIQLETESAYPKDIKKWLLLGRTDAVTVCHSSARADAGNVPPSNRWKNQRSDIRVKGEIYTGKGVVGVQLSLEPKISHAKDRAYFNTDGKSKNSDGVMNSRSVIVDNLLVEGCVDEVNGIYNKNGYANDAPVYYKARSDGLPCVKLYRGGRYWNNNGCYWYISVLKGDTWCSYYRLTVDCEGLPLTREWTRTESRASGMLPLVKLSTGRSNKRARTS